MIRKIIVSACLISMSFGFQNTSFSLFANNKNEMSKIYLSKNRIPQEFDSQILANFKFEKLNKNKRLIFVANVFFDQKKAQIFELGIKYKIKSSNILIGMIDDKNYNFTGINEHIIFGNSHAPLKKITFESNSDIPLPFLNELPFFNKVFFTYNFSNALLDKDYKYLWDDYYWQEAKEVYYSKEPRLHYKKLNFKYKLNQLTSIELGLNHAAIWGGTVVNKTNDTIKVFPNDINSLHKVIFWQGGTVEYDRNDVTGGVIGNHLGSIDFAITSESKSLITKYYYQHIFEDGGSFWFDNKFDGLWGVNLQNKNNSSRIKEVTLEFLNTKFQSGNIHPDGVDSYFWHDQYPAGWQYEGVSMGSLFISPNQNRSKILFISSKIKLNENVDLLMHAGLGKIYHYYGYKGWNEEVETLFSENYNGKYKSAYLSMKRRLKNDSKLEINLIFEESLKTSYSPAFEKKISTELTKFLNITYIKNISLN